ncbi:MAG: YdcH family protein [Rhizobiaceae bacterium]|nr:YdcH family protein [Hyphomicrobiales bacterium]NRB30767.1 YdcH family protein [Rhizobiaceae bacterium]
MSHVPHELPEEFPDKIQAMHDLKMSDAHFQRLAEEYHELNRQIHRVETGVEPTSEQFETELRKKRLHLKDEIASILAAA